MIYVVILDKESKRRFIESNKVSEMMEPPSIESQASVETKLIRACTHDMVRAHFLYFEPEINALLR